MDLIVYFPPNTQPSPRPPSKLWPAWLADLLGQSGHAHPARISGSEINAPILVDHLIEEGDFERVAYYNAAAPVETVRGTKILSISPGNFEHLAELEEAVVFCPGGEFAQARALRRAFAPKPWIVSSVMHSVSYKFSRLEFLQSLIEPAYEFDSLICPTEAARSAVTNIIEYYQSALAQSGDLKNPIPYQTPVIPFGVDIQRFHPGDRGAARKKFGIAPDRYVVLCVGRLSIATKADLTPIIIHFLEKFRGLPAELVIAGADNANRASLRYRSVAKACGDTNQVKVLTDVSGQELPLLYTAADIFISPSDSVQETFGSVVVEAMASALPVVCSNWSGYRDLNVDGETGFLVKSRWCPEVVDTISRLDAVLDDWTAHYWLGQSAHVDPVEFTQRCYELYLQPERRAAMGKAARERAVQRYAWPLVARKMVDHWKECQALRRLKESHTSSSVFASSLNYNWAFEDFPSDLVNFKNLWLESTVIGRRLLSCEKDFFHLLPETDLFRGELQMKIMHAIAKQAPVNAALLIEDSAAAGSFSPWRAQVCIGRLLKYGLAQIATRSQ